MADLSETPAKASAFIGSRSKRLYQVYQSKKERERQALAQSTQRGSIRRGAASILQSSMVLSPEHEAEPEHFALLSKHGRNLFSAISQVSRQTRGAYHRGKDASVKSASKVAIKAPVAGPSPKSPAPGARQSGPDKAESEQSSNQSDQSATADQTAYDDSDVGFAATGKTRTAGPENHAGETSPAKSRAGLSALLSEASAVGPEPAPIRRPARPRGGIER